MNEHDTQLQTFLNELVGCECASFAATKKLVSHINERRKALGLDLFLDQNCTHQVSISVQKAPSYPSGRLDVKDSKIPQKKRYFRTFPQLYLGRITYLPVRWSVANQLITPKQRKEQATKSAQARGRSHGH